MFWPQKFQEHDPRPLRHKSTNPVRRAPPTPARSPQANARGFLVSSAHWRGGFAAVAVFLIVVSIGATRTVDGVPRALPALARFLMHFPAPAVWMVSALGVGLFASRLLGVRSLGWQISLAIGVALSLFVDTFLGSIGFFGIAQRPGALAVVVLGMFLLWREYQPDSNAPAHGRIARTAGPWLAWTIAPAVGVLVLAVVSAPGWLWSTEFGGYDALSYHLELPREWLALGRIQTLHHNIYSSFPSFQEAANLHLMSLSTNAQSAALDAQILHGFMALAAACAVGRLAQTVHDRACGAHYKLDPFLPRVRSAVGWCAGGVFLGLPWIIVTGSLAYCEMPVLLFFAAALTVTLAFETTTLTRTFVALAILCAGAMGAKLTSGLFVVAPVAMLCTFGLIGRTRAVAIPPRALVKPLTIAMLVFLALLAPWWVRNAISTGSPIFPFFATLADALGISWLGHGTLSLEQLSVFERAHGALPASSWWEALCDQWLLVGLTQQGPVGEPWRPFWSILPWLALACAVVLIVRPSSRRVTLGLVAIVLLQAACWLLFTHAKGRFLIPTVVPLAVIASLASANLVRARALGCATLASLLSLWCTQPLVAYATDGPLIDGVYSPATGIGLEPLLSGTAGGDGLPAALARLPTTARVVSLGATNVFWWAMIPGYSTVWDSNPVAVALEQSGNDPDRTIGELRRAGFTHIVIDGSMLERWHRSGWLDPRISDTAVERLARRVRPLSQGGEVVLFELKEPEP